MNKLLCIAAALSILMLSGCASNQVALQPILSTKESRAAGSSYVAGMFSRNWGTDKLSFGLGIVNVETKEEYVMPFGIDTGLPRSVVDEFVMIQLPSGEYKVSNWVAYSNSSLEMVSKTEITPDVMPGLQFKLAPGEVVFIGSHVARDTRNLDVEGKRIWTVHHQRLNRQSAIKALEDRYYLFSAEPLSCPSCIN